MQRFLPPVYEDGVQSVRLSVFGNTLPSPRQISTDVHRDQNREIHSVTLMFTQWGQFIDHDITSTVKSRAFNGSIPRCCSKGGGRVLPAEFLHPSCLPIEVPISDRFLSKFGIGCMEFTRSAPSTRIDCDLGWREQINQVTSFIDGSTIYGSDRESSDIIRTFRNGMIFYGKPTALPAQPLSTDQDFPSEGFCKSGPLTEECIQPGDLRASENPGLVAIHTIFVRYHNKVASVLSQINPHWSDWRIFEETRKIVYSVIQHITYREYLPVVVGPQVIDLFDLKLTNTGYFKNYESRVNPTIANSFSTAAFRFGHSMVQNSFIRTDSHHRPIHNNVTLHNELDNEENIWSIGSLDRLLLGLINQPSQKRDEFVAEELTNHLFQSGDSSHFGMDLAAINIQRGRDHGIPPYTFWREPCGLPPIKSWDDLKKVINIQTVIKLESLYAHVDDIDLFTAGLAEKPLRGAVVGPTFSCIIAQQFSNLRKGDRFWYENSGFPSAFSLEQLEQIRKVSLAQVICQTINEVQTIQQFVFLSADNFRNSRVSCDSHEIKGFDLAAWRQEDFETNNIAGDEDDFEFEKSHKQLSSNSRRKRDNKRKNKLTVTTPIPQKKNKMTLKNDTVSAQLKYETFTHKSTHRPTTYYKIKDQSNNDVTYLLGLVSQGPTRSPPMQIHININYGPQVNTPATIHKRPSSTTLRPTYNDNNAVLITKRPVTRLTTTTENSVSYPTFIYSSSPKRPTNKPLYVSSNMQYATTHGLKRPNSNKLSHRPTMTTPGYFGDIDSAGQSPSHTFDYIYDPVVNFHKRPTYTSATNHHRPQHMSGPTIFEDRPFSTSTYNTYDRTKRPMHDQDLYSHNSNYDHQHKPQTGAYDRNENDFSDDISQEFFDRFDVDEAGKGGFDETATRRVGVDDKLDLNSRIFLERPQSDFDDFVQMSAVKKAVTFGLDTDRNRHERAAHQDQGPNLLSAFNLLRSDAFSDREVAKLPLNLPCSYQVPKPTVEYLPAMDEDSTTMRTR
ncbi:chorion peroxidase-like [Euwallacea similis]|uniref:chorion peroxidase-like n=1 Tax=Euwallacea similis TaxID=1736056 RepID=UPI0034504F30